MRSAGTMALRRGQLQAWALEPYLCRQASAGRNTLASSQQTSPTKQATKYLNKFFRLKLVSPVIWGRGSLGGGGAKRPRPETQLVILCRLRFEIVPQLPG